MMRPDVRPPVKLESLEIERADSLDAPRPRFKRLKETNNGIVALIVIVILVVLIGGGAAIYMLLLHSNPFVGSQGSPETQPSTGSQKLAAKSLVSKAKDVAQGQVKQTLQDTDGKPYNTYGAPPLRPDGYSFSVRSDTDYGFATYATKGVIATDVLNIQKTLTDNGLKGTVLDPGSDEAIYAALYESDDIICSVSDQKPYKATSTSTDYSMSLGCADKSDYLANAATLRPYFIVYASQSRFDTTHTLMGSVTLKQSKTDGYSTATVPISGSTYGSVGGFAGLYYITPDKTLHYFTGTQSELACGMYSTVDLKKAYLGEKCYDESDSISTVKL